MIRETELFFDEVLKHDLSLTNFVASDFTMLNGRLAKHYGIPGVDGWEFRKVTLPPDSHRGGVLTMASVLKVTANGTTTSPVIRGAWVLDRILGTPPPPPPDDVPAIEPDIRGATTIREQLAKHRADRRRAAVATARSTRPGLPSRASTASAAGATTTASPATASRSIVDGRRMPYHKGKKVDPSDVMADGEQFENIDEFKQLLLKDKDQLARALTDEAADLRHRRARRRQSTGPRSRRSSRRSRDKNYGLRSLVHEIVQSELFRNK